MLLSTSALISKWESSRANFQSLLNPYPISHGEPYFAFDIKNSTGPESRDANWQVAERRQDWTCRSEWTPGPFSPHPGAHREPGLLTSVMSDCLAVFPSPPQWETGERPLQQDHLPENQMTTRGFSPFFMLPIIQQPTMVPVEGLSLCGGVQGTED